MTPDQPTPTDCDSRTTSQHARRAVPLRCWPARLVGAAATLVLVAMTVGGCAGGGAADDGDDASTAGGEAIPLQSFARHWSSDMRLSQLGKGARVSEVHVRDENVFAYTSTGYVVALARGDGRLQYVNRVRNGQGGNMHPPVVLKELIVIPTLNSLELYNKAGRYQRSVSLPFALRSDATGAVGNLYVGGDFQNSSRVASLNLTRDYSPVDWQVMITRGGVSAAPAVQGDALYFGGGDGSVYAVTADEGRPIWDRPNSGPVVPTGGAITGDLFVDASGLYVASTDTKLYAIERNTGAILWEFHAGVPLRTGPVATDTTVYQLVPGAGIAALSKDAGGEFLRRPLWLLPGTKQFLAEDEQHAYLGREDNSIVAVDKASGEVKFESKRKDFAAFGVNTGAPDAGGGIIFAATKKGRVYAIKPVLKPGVVGEIVWVERPVGALAAAR